MVEAMVRLATTADIPAIRALLEASVRGLNRDLYSPAQLESSLRFVFGVDSQLIADRTYFVIEDEAGLVAAGGWSKRATLYGGDQWKGEDPLLDPARDAARIRAFFVHPRAARRGLGRQLFEVCRDAALADGFRALELGATLPGVVLYEALGFIEVERVEHELPDGVRFPLVKMRRAIP
ncbi:MAG: GNAT family N-acetyltransferase [Deltaproteobacteria bacterium]|nr:GNAT family N-acetyltransferase [Deltaproteobacteria bacterium]